MSVLTFYQICTECGEQLESTGHVCKGTKAQKPMGWQCPKCGRGNSPYSTVCPCGPDVKSTTANAGYVKLIQTRWGGYIDRGDGAGSG